MTNTRQNVWDLGTHWADPILWYARGVKVMRSRPLADPTSWRFYAGIHGFNASLWQTRGYYNPQTDPLPSTTLQQTYWNQCQHGSWYFLPWHRGYLQALEANIRAIVVGLGGPSDWALPYWNYFKPGENELPPEFASPGWPVDSDPNPLYVKERYGPNGDGNVFVPLSDVNLDAMYEPLFTGKSTGGSPGFGGLDTGFMHNGATHGALESQPHDMVHVYVGYRSKVTGQQGLMAVPDTAGLDPIFYLHHANIDRLWESWNDPPPTLPSHSDPTEPKWLKGPVSLGERAFVMPMPNGAAWDYTPEQMMSISSLGYQYDDLTPAGMPLAPAPPGRLAFAAVGGEGGAVADDHEAELVGANDEIVTIRSEASTRVRLDRGVRRRMAGRPAPREGAPRSDRVFLNVESVRGRVDASAFRVYLGVPEGESVEAHRDLLAGTIAPFGLGKASDPDEEHAGEGLTYVLDVTGIVNRLHEEGSFDVDDLPVRIVPVEDFDDEGQVTVGRISLFREGQ